MKITLSRERVKMKAVQSFRLSTTVSPKIVFEIREQGFDIGLFFVPKPERLRV
jgi:hypothetical protein